LAVAGQNFHTLRIRGSDHHQGHPEPTRPEHPSPHLWNHSPNSLDRTGV
jgi:hypothetical protein